MPVMSKMITAQAVAETNKRSARELARIGRYALPVWDASR